MEVLVVWELQDRGNDGSVGDTSRPGPDGTDENNVIDTPPPQFQVGEEEPVSGVGYALPGLTPGTSIREVATCRPT